MYNKKDTNLGIAYNMPLEPAVEMLMSRKPDLSIEGAVELLKGFSHLIPMSEYVKSPSGIEFSRLGLEFDRLAREKFAPESLVPERQIPMIIGPGLLPMKTIRTTEPVSTLQTMFKIKIPGDIKTAVARQVAPERPTMPAIQSQFYGGVAPKGIAKFLADGGLIGLIRRWFAPKPEPVQIVDSNEYL